MTQFEPLSHGITLIDTGFQRPGFDASYLIVENGRAAFVDSGPNQAVPRLLAALSAQGLAADAVDWLILTHVHLDHAGGAGRLMRQLPRARLAVHARGARHMVDPSQMMAAVRAVYGDEAVQRDYGELVPVHPGRVTVVEDGATLELAGRRLRFVDTPGHARHHHCIWDEASEGIFSGDTLGVAYPELRGECGHFGIPSTSPSQFDPEALHRSIGRLLALGPRVAYLSHFGAITRVAEHADMVLRQADRMVQIARSLPNGAGRGSRLRQSLASLYLRELGTAGVNLPRARAAELLANDLELNAQGLEAWLASQR
ncbi:MBL fold metallo-hydrolase [Ramlibacter sp. 2FC]|uniref:MBL fold metallo-hydrolase n=1 Tax=Ramlibacter sp. 2FC TaxID=2502188 RepID=UPI0010F85432|nr:MBL fold metallo-hydrolase [Ramlibacter sp. 2FC]